MSAALAAGVAGAATAGSAAALRRREASRQPQGRGCGEAAAPLSFAACKEQQLVLLLARQLASAQFELAHAEMAQRLWDEVAALGIDPERVTQLLYGGHDPNDRLGLLALENVWLEAHRPAVGRWLRRITGAAWRRGVPPAGPRAHR
ncbi:MAG: hypothetical protein ACKOAP_09315 [Vulcanococcus sp.]